MIVKINKKIGNTTLQFEVEGDKERDALFAASSFTTIPEVCGNCESTDLVLDGQKSQGFTFVKVKCLKCNARSQMGERKDGGVFWKTFEKYSPEEEKNIKK